MTLKIELPENEWDSDDQDASLASRALLALISQGKNTHDTEQVLEAARELGRHTELFAWFVSRHAKSWKIAGKCAGFEFSWSFGAKKRSVVEPKLALVMARAVVEMTEPIEDVPDGLIACRVLRAGDQKRLSVLAVSQDLTDPNGPFSKIVGPNAIRIRNASRAIVVSSTTIDPPPPGSSVVGPESDFDWRDS